MQVGTYEFHYSKWRFYPMAIFMLGLIGLFILLDIGILIVLPGVWMEAHIGEIFGFVVLLFMPFFLGWGMWHIARPVLHAKPVVVVTSEGIEAPCLGVKCLNWNEIVEISERQKGVLVIKSASRSKSSLAAAFGLKFPVSIGVPLYLMKKGGQDLLDAIYGYYTQRNSI